jgi:hypothetical protein
MGAAIARCLVGRARRVLTMKLSWFAGAGIEGAGVEMVGRGARETGVLAILALAPSALSSRRRARGSRSPEARRHRASLKAPEMPLREALVFGPKSDDPLAEPDQFPQSLGLGGTTTSGSPRSIRRAKVPVRVPSLPMPQAPVANVNTKALPGVTTLDSDASSEGVPRWWSCPGTPRTSRRPGRSQSGRPPPGLCPVSRAARPGCRRERHRCTRRE